MNSYSNEQMKSKQLKKRGVTMSEMKVALKGIDLRELCGKD